MKDLQMTLKCFEMEKRNMKTWYRCAGAGKGLRSIPVYSPRRREQGYTVMPLSMFSLRAETTCSSVVLSKNS